MKRILLFIVIILQVVIGWAAKAWNQPLLVKQSDGTTLTIRIYGDEHFSWRTTLDGVLIQQVGTDYYIGVIDEKGNLTASNQLAHEKPLRSVTEQLIADRQNKDLFFKKNYSELANPLTRNIPIGTGTHLFPHKGNPKALVILAQFKDVRFTLPNPRKSFEQYLNSMNTHQNYGNDEQRNYGSVKKYFSDMSKQKFVPHFDLYGPITLPKGMDYYGKGNKEFGQQVYDVIIDACNLMDDSLDFSQYDSNNDGYVDLVYVIYAGYGENMSNNVNTLWPKAFSVNHTTAEGKKVGRCGISNELIGDSTAFATAGITPRINGIGLFCHEFSHCLGLPDFYPTNTGDKTVFPNLSSFDNQGMEAWSIMDYGCYMNNGYRPTAYTAWEREAMGWITVDTLKTTQSVTIKSIDEDDGKAYRILNDDDPSGNDYYMIQNIQNIGWNAPLGAHGLMMYHVNYNNSLFDIKSNKPNNVKNKPRMTVIPADGQLLASYRINEEPTLGGITSAEFRANLPGDLFPGKNNITEIKDSMNLINYTPWVGSDSILRKPITNIQEISYTNNAGITTNYIIFNIKMLDKDGISTGINQSILYTTDNINDGRIYRLDGSFVGTSMAGLPKGIYIRNKKKFIIP